MVQPPKPKGPPPPFEFKLDLPPEGAEVPFVKNYEPPPPPPPEQEQASVPENSEGEKFRRKTSNDENG